MNTRQKKIAIVIIVMLILIISLIYILNNSTSSTQESTTLTANTTEVTEQTLGNIDELQESDIINEQVKQLEENMNKSEVQDILDTEPISSGELNATAYNSYERYDLEDGYVYDIYYQDDSLVGISQVKQ